MIPPYQQWLQRNEQTIRMVVNGLLLLVIIPSMTVLITIIWLGANRHHTPPEPVVKGNVACWFDADGRMLTVVKGETKLQFPIATGKK